MPAFTRMYTDQQREAMAAAFVGGMTCKAVVAAAGAGELVHNGQRLEAFEAKPSTVRDLGRRLRKRRAGELHSQLLEASPRDAVEALRRRLVSAADHELDALEGARKRGERVDLERLRQVARTVREAAAIPGPTAPRPPAPGVRDRDTGVRVGGPTRGGLAAQILEATARGPAGPVMPPPEPEREPELVPEPDVEPEPAALEDPGAWAAAQIAELGLLDSAPDDGPVRRREAPTSGGLMLSRRDGFRYDRLAAEDDSATT